MRIIILSDGFPPTGLGGGEIIPSNLTHLLLSKGHDVFVITTTQKKSEVGIVEAGKLTVYRIYSEYNLRFRSYVSLCNPAVLKEVQKIMENVNPDIVHAHNIHTHLSYASLKLAKKYSKGVFLTFHDVMSVHYGKVGAKVDSFGKVTVASMSPLEQIFQYKFYYNPLRNIVIRYYLRYVSKMLSVSSALKDVLEVKGIKPIEVLHNGIDVSVWQVDDLALLDFKRRYNLENKKVLFLAGRVSSAKGSMVLVDVLNKLSSKLSDVVLLVAGNKTRPIEEMVEKAKKLGLEKQVIFTGWIENKDMRYAYASSDIVFVLSQYIDPFPTNNLEAMASKRPVIGTSLGGTPEAVLDNETGYIVDPRDINQISEKALELLNNKEKTESFGLAGYDRAKEIFSADAWVNETLTLYDMILHKNK